MKKTLLTFSVILAAICCTLAYDASGLDRLPLLETSNAPTQEPQSTIEGSKEAIVVTNPKHGLQINPESILRASSRVAEFGTKKNAKTSSFRQGNVQEIVVSLWDTATQIYSLNNGGSFDVSTNTLSFAGSSELTNQIFTDVNEEGNYGWYAVGGQTYQFSGTLSSSGDATVLPCVVYYNGNGLYIANNTTISLNEANGYSSDFNVSASGIQDGCAIMVAFLIEDSSSEITITSTNNQFYYSYETTVAQEWTAENDIPGLGLNGFSYGTYTVTCADGVTTLGLFYNGSLYVTGINTTASEVILPSNITIGEDIMQVDYFGYNGQMDWSGAPNLTTLDISAASRFYASFGNSAITDLFISANCDFYNRPSDVSEIYLHIPYEASRNDYTYYGFKRVLVGEEQPNYPISSNSNWVIAGEDEGDYFGISTYNNYFTISEVFTERDSVALPIATPADGGMYYIRYFGNDGSYSSTLCQNASALKAVAIPQTYTNLRVNWSYNHIVDLHMQGDVPSTNWNMTSNMTVYVGNQSYYTNYENNSSWNSATIVPEGWEFEWMTVNVGRKGEFAQTYIEMTDANWALGMYVKITGTLNTTDLQNIINLTSLRKLDLSEAEFAGLPNSFLESKSTLMEVYLPDYLTSIPQYAFRYCSALSVVSAPGVTSVGNSAFYNCSKLTEFDLSKVNVINQQAFYNCSLFNPADLSSVYSIGSNAFYNTAIREVAIPEGVSTINSSVFSNCTLLSKVTLPSTITSIGNNAFNQCTTLVSINLPEGITSIGYDAFNNCSHLPEVTLPSTLQSINYDIFDGCTSLETVKCKAIVPPASNGEFTYGVDLNHCTLYVAPFAIDAYRAAADWSNFYIMKPLNEPVKNIYINRPMIFDLLSEDNAVLQENPNMTLDYSTSSYYYGDNVGQLYAQGDGTLSAGVFKILHSFGRRYNASKSDYRTTLINDAENMRADSVLCSIDFEKNRWHFISFQYDVQMEDIFGVNNTDFVIRQYNSENRASGDGTTSNWENVPADGVLKAGKGYIIQVANNSTNESGNTNSAIVRFPSRNTVTKNNLFTSNNVIVSLEEYPAEFAHNRSWNLVGNPYPCYYDMHYLMDDFSTPIVLWRGTSYQAYSPIDDDIILRPNEAFFVQKPLDAEEMIFGVEGRMNYSTAYIYSSATPGAFNAPARSSRSISERAVFNFNIGGCGTEDRARIVLNEDALMDYEINRDASKFFSMSAEGAEIYVDGNIKYDICERPLAEGVATLGTRIGTKGEYTISLTGRNMGEWIVMLTDTQTGITTNLTEDAYTFDAETGTAEGRFIVTFKAPGQSAIEDVNLSNGDNVVRIVNTAGVTVFNGELDDFKATAPTGIYIVVGVEQNYKIVVK